MLVAYAICCIPCAILAVVFAVIGIIMLTWKVIKAFVRWLFWLRDNT